ncbi:MAG: hypothetical protein AAFP99_07095, partial [Pseudomonadota bacterium]
IARLYGAFIMGFDQGRELVENSGVPLLTPEEFRALLDHERAIVRWLLENEQFGLSDDVKAALTRIDSTIFNATDSAEYLAQLGYPVVRNLLTFTARGLAHVERIGGRLSLAGVPIHLLVQGSLLFVVSNYAHLAAFSASTPELNAYIQYQLRRLGIDENTKLEEIDHDSG